MANGKVTKPARTGNKRKHADMLREIGMALSPMRPYDSAPAELRHLLVWAQREIKTLRAELVARPAAGCKAERWEDQPSATNDMDKLRAEFRERLYGAQAPQPWPEQALAEGKALPDGALKEG